MRLEKTWNANSKAEGPEKGEDLAVMASGSRVGMEVWVTKPYVYSERGLAESKPLELAIKKGQN